MKNKLVIIEFLPLSVNRSVALVNLLSQKTFESEGILSYTLKVYKDNDKYVHRITMELDYNFSAVLLQQLISYLSGNERIDVYERTI